MVKLKKIFPFNGIDNFNSSLKLVFIAEGYRDEDQLEFTSDCLNFIEALYKTPPFNLTRINNYWISIYTAFAPSQERGPVIDDVRINGRTVFDSILDSSNGLLKFDKLKIDGFIEQIKIDAYGSEDVLSSYIVKGNPIFWHSSFIPILLLPKIDEFENRGEFENGMIENHFYFVATSVNKYWQQIIFRTIGKYLGLGDEFEESGPDAKTPYPTDTDSSLISYPFNNLGYLEEGQIPSIRNMKWYSLLKSTQRNTPLQVKKSQNDDTPNHQIPTFPTTSHNIEPWEGGGGFRKNIFRSSFDCLMRRKIGSELLPVKEKNVPFCKVCRETISNIIL